jgi:hypothetical protein
VDIIVGFVGVNLWNGNGYKNNIILEDYNKRKGFSMEKLSKILLVLLIITGGLLVYFIYGFTVQPSEQELYLPVLHGADVTVYKNSCVELDISQACADPIALDKRKVKVTGLIDKKEEFEQFGKTRTYLELKVLNASPDFYILVNYSETMPFKEGDMITAYGECLYPARTADTSKLANKTLIRIDTVHIET